MLVGWNFCGEGVGVCLENVDFGDGTSLAEGAVAVAVGVEAVSISLGLSSDVEPPEDEAELKAAIDVKLFPLFVGEACISRVLRGVKVASPDGVDEFASLLGVSGLLDVKAVGVVARMVVAGDCDEGDSGRRKGEARPLLLERDILGGFCFWRNAEGGWFC